MGSAAHQPEPTDQESESRFVWGQVRGRTLGRAEARVREELLAELESLEYQRATEVQDRFRGAQKLERTAVDVRQKDLQKRAVLVRADMLLRMGDTVRGARLAKEVNRWAQAHGPDYLLARSHLVLSSTYEVIGDAASCLDHALRAVELVGSQTAPRVRGNFIMRLGDALAFARSYNAARQRYQEAARIFLSIDDVERRLTALNNLAYAEYEAGNQQESWRVATQMHELADRSGISLNPEFLDTLAHAQLGFGEFALAESSLLAALDQLGEGGDMQPSTPAQLLLTLAQVQRQQGRLVAAQDSLDRCLAICVDRELVAIRVDALREQAEVHAANGRFMLAYHLHKTYHEEALSLSSWQQEARARARQVMLETEEARSEARRFREQARTDALTGLKNRRYVDEELQRLLDAAEQENRPVGAAILDVDYFKRINDTLSHDVGDKVIRAIADLVERALTDLAPGSSGSPPGFAARLGGEEYLVVLIGRRLDRALAFIESLRESVAAYSWTELTGSLSVTVSAGLAMAEPGDSQASLLRSADQALYAAKDAGRNQVVVANRTAAEEPSITAGDGGSVRVSFPEQGGQPDLRDGHGRYRRRQGRRTGCDTVDLSVVARMRTDRSSARDH